MILKSNSRSNIDCWARSYCRSIMFKCRFWELSKHWSRSSCCSGFRSDYFTKPKCWDDENYNSTHWRAFV